MKTTATLVLLMGLLVWVLVSAAPNGMQIPKGDCCDNVSRINIPEEKIVQVAKTPRHCRPAAIIVETPKKTLCLDPSWDWAINHLMRFQKNQTAKSQ